MKYLDNTSWNFIMETSIERQYILIDLNYFKKMFLPVSYSERFKKDHLKAGVIISSSVSK